MLREHVGEAEANSWNSCVAAGGVYLQRNERTSSGGTDAATPGETCQWMSHEHILSEITCYFRL